VSHQKGFTEGIYLGATMYTYVIAYLVGLPIAFVLQDSPIVQYGVVSGLVLLCTLVTPVLNLVPKVSTHYYSTTSVSKELV
jgi:hypothetical protein